MATFIDIKIFEFRRAFNFYGLFCPRIIPLGLNPSQDHFGFTIMPHVETFVK